MSESQSSESQSSESAREAASGDATSSGSASSVPAVELRSVVKRYGDLVVLNEIDLSVAAAEKVALIGPSGSGKSTILRVLMALEGIQGGEVRVQGRSLFGGDAKDDEGYRREVGRAVGMVFQHFHLFPHLSVLANLTLAPREVLGKSKDAAEATARELLEKVGLADKADVFPKTLSGGQKQRVAIARALAMEPAILLFDEITSALDPELVGDVLEVLRRLGDETDVTMLLVTHQMGFAREFADRVLFLESGRILEQGPAAQLFDAPKHERTKAFLESVALAG